MRERKILPCTDTEPRSESLLARDYYVNAYQNSRPDTRTPPRGSSFARIRRWDRGKKLLNQRRKTPNGCKRRLRTSLVGESLRELAGI